jgi:putative ABC transport system permease protein
MLLNYFKIAFRNLVRHKLYTLINVFGLAIGIGFCVLIALFIRDEYSFDDFHANGDRLYRVMTEIRKPNGERESEAYQPMPLAPALRSGYPEVVRSTRFVTGSAIVKHGENVFRETIAFADPDLLEMFTFPLAVGDASGVFSGQNGIVLNETSAKKYFGGDEPMGKRLTVDIRGQKDDFLVTGVMKDLPATSSLVFDFLLPIARNGNYDVGKDRWTSANGSAYVQLGDGADPATLSGKMGPFIENHFGQLLKVLKERDEMAADADAYRIWFQPIREIHLDTETTTSPEARSDPAYSYILGAIGIFVLLIACINFTTLAIGRSAGRAREVGMRKVLGAVRSQVMRQFWGEALILCFIALIVGVVMAEVALPAFNVITGKKLTLDYFTDAWIIVALGGILGLVGLAAGSYPAAFLSRFEPVEVLKGKARFAGRTPLTRALIVVQFSLSIVLIVSTLVMAGQMEYILSQDLGYHAEQVVVLQLFDGRDSPGLVRAERLKATLAGVPGVLGVSGTNSAFTHGYDINGFKHHGMNRTAYIYRVDEQFIQVLGITLKEGRNFNPAAAGEGKGSVIVNEALVRDYGWTGDAVGTRLEGWDEEGVPGGPVVIGVVKDFNFGSLREPIRPAVLFTNPGWGMDQALIRISAENIPETMERIRSVWAGIAPDKPYNATFLSEDVQKQYEKEQRWMEILQAASVMAIALACMGLFGLAGLSVVNRTKEIGIRKVLGASVSGIAAMLSKEFAILVLISNALALPAAYLAASKWLESYPYRVELGPAVFLAGGLGALAIALATVSLHAVRAARANPVESLRYE